MKRTLALVACLVVSGLGVACTDDVGGGEIEKLRDDVPDPPAGGAQLVTPTWKVDAGTESFTCFRIPFEVTEDMYVINSQVFQMDSGHHTFVYFTEGDADDALDPEPHDCDGLDMTNVRVAASGSADGSSFFIADDIALEIPKGAELWAQSHYINGSDQARTVQDVINLTLKPVDEIREIASTFAQLDLTFALPPQQSTTRMVECHVQQEMYVPWFLPHMHEWGTSYKIEVMGADGEMKYQTGGPWSEQFRNDFQVAELDEHMLLTPEDTIRTTCEWFNSESEVMLFPQEMCVTFFPFYPGDGSLWACDESGDTFRP